MAKRIPPRRPIEPVTEVQPMSGGIAPGMAPAKSAKDKTDFIDHKVWDREPEPATLSGLALALGFISIAELEAYERDGKFAHIIKKARLKVEAEYEKRLHYQSATGAIFFLKNLGWNEKPDDSLLKEIPKTIKIEIVNSGPKLVSSEKDVTLLDKPHPNPPR